MRLWATFLTVAALALATMFVHAGGAMAMSADRDAVMMAEMGMGTDGAPVCPPQMCAKMKSCAASSAPVAALVPAAAAAAFDPVTAAAGLAPHGPDSLDPVVAQGPRRPPRFI